MPFFRQNSENRSGLPRGAVVALAAGALVAVFGVSLGVPLVRRSRRRSEEAALRVHLSTLRTALRAYEAQAGKLPSHASDLVKAGILRQLPVDPFTGRSDTWRLGGLTGIQSASDALALNGQPYSTW